MSKHVALLKDSTHILSCLYKNAEISVSLNILIKTGILSLKQFLCNSLVFLERSLSILKDEDLQGREETIFATFSVMRFFEHSITPSVNS